MSKIQKPYHKKQFFNKSSSKRFSIDVNLKGFLCSCNHREKDCVRESYNILNKYADILWPPKPTESQSDKGVIEEDLESELKELRSDKRDMKRFQLVDSGAKNFLFIKTTLEDPVQLAETILRNIYEKKNQESRFLLRLIPVEVTCKAYVSDIEKAFEPLCEKHFSEKAKTYSIVFNHRNNSSLSRDEIIRVIADQVTKHGKSKDLEHKVDLTNAEICIIIEIVRGFAFLGVVPNYFKYKKYNLLAFAENQEGTGKGEVGEGNIEEKETSEGADNVEATEDSKTIQ